MSYPPKSWNRKFETYCPQTNTGLWWGISRKQTYTETQMREDLYKWNTYPPDGTVPTTVFNCFIYYVLSDDLLRQFAEILKDVDRENLENTVYTVLIKKDLRPQNCVINCINYVKLGLVKYFEELNSVLKIKGDNNENK